MNEQQILFGIALFSTVLFCVKLVLMGVTGEGADTEVNMDLADDVDGSESFEYLSVQTVLTFLMMFSWSALALKYEMKNSSLVAYSLSSFIGLLTSFAIGYSMKKLKSLATDHPKSLVPQIDDELVVYSTISKDGYGEVKFILNNETFYIKAYTEDPQDIPKGSRVKVLKNKPNLVVTKL